MDKDVDNYQIISYKNYRKENMRYKYKVRELSKDTSEDMEAMSLKKLRRKLDHKKEYAIEYTNKHNNFISTTTRGIEPK